jgi:type I restriction enzyme R subunit
LLALGPRDGCVVPVGKGLIRKPPKRVDYLLRYTRVYAEMLQLKFAYATTDAGGTLGMLPAG